MKRFLEPETQAYDGDAEAWRTWQVSMPPPPAPPLRANPPPIEQTQSDQDDVEPTLNYDELLGPTLDYEMAAGAAAVPGKDTVATEQAPPAAVAATLAYPCGTLAYEDDSSTAMKDQFFPPAFAATLAYEDGGANTAFVAGGALDEAAWQTQCYEPSDPVANGFPPNAFPPPLVLSMQTSPIAAPSAAKPSQTALERPQPGARVRLRNLLAMPELDGSFGTCRQLDEERGRWIVLLESGEQRALKEENLEVLVSNSGHGKNVTTVPTPPRAAPSPPAVRQKVETLRSSSPQAPSNGYESVRIASSPPRAAPTPPLHVRRPETTPARDELPARKAAVAVGIHRRRLRGKQPPTDAWRLASELTPSPATRASTTASSRRTASRPTAMRPAATAEESSKHCVVGSRVRVTGDGWGGGGRDEYMATVTEADDLTFTVVFESSSDRWEETHVLREHCSLVPFCEPSSGGVRSSAAKRRRNS